MSFHCKTKKEITFSSRRNCKEVEVEDENGLNLSLMNFKRGPWTVEEDTLLIHSIALHGEGRWNLLSMRSGLRRTGKSCRLRWLNYLKPDVKRGNISPQEQLLILQLHSRWGNRWSKIAQQLPGRTDNEIKNYWRTRVLRQAKLLKIETNSPKFNDIVRRFWIPNLIHQINQSSSSSLINLPKTKTLSNPQVLETPTRDDDDDDQDHVLVSLSSAGIDDLDSFVKLNPDDQYHSSSSSCITRSESMMNISAGGCGSASFSDPFTSVVVDLPPSWNRDDRFDMTTTSSNVSASEDFCYPMPMADCHAPQQNLSNWTVDNNCDYAASFFNLDDLWQF